MDAVVPVSANETPELLLVEGLNLLRDEPISKTIPFKNRPLRWKIVDGIEVFSEFSVTVKVELKVLKTSFFIPTEFEVTASLTYVSRTGIEFKKEISGAEANVVNVPLPLPAPVPIPLPIPLPIYLLIQPRLEFFAEASWSAEMDIELVQRYEERLAYTLVRRNSEWSGTYKRDNQKSILENGPSFKGVLSSSFGAEFVATVLVNGLFGLEFGAKASNLADINSCVVILSVFCTSFSLVQDVPSNVFPHVVQC